MAATVAAAVADSSGSGSGSSVRGSCSESGSRSRHCITCNESNNGWCIGSTILHVPASQIKREVPSFGQFQEVTLDEIINKLRAAPSKQYALDPAPTCLVKQMSDTILD